MYTYRDVKSGEAYRGLLESLGLEETTEKRSNIYKTYPNGLLFEAYFGYATFNHYPGNFSGIPVFRVISPHGGNLRENSDLTAQKDSFIF